MQALDVKMLPAVSARPIALQNVAGRMVASYRFQMVSDICKVKPPTAKSRFRMRLSCGLQCRNRIGRVPNIIVET